MNIDKDALAEIEKTLTAFADDNWGLDRAKPGVYYNAGRLCVGIVIIDEKGKMDYSPELLTDTMRNDMRSVAIDLDDLLIRESGLKSADCLLYNGNSINLEYWI
jgi:hypothetical protein